MKAAGSGHMESQFRLGMIYTGNYGFPANRKIIRKLPGGRRSGNAGSVPAY